MSYNNLSYDFKKKGLIMARLIITNILKIGDVGKLDSIQWEVYEDSTMSVLIDSFVDTTEFKLEWITPLPKSSGGFYSDLPNIYGRAKLNFTGTHINSWRPVVCDQVTSNLPINRAYLYDAGIIRVGDDDVIVEM